VTQGKDVLAWLLPEVGEPARADARRVVTALRLLRDAARAGAGATLSLSRARAELERVERDQRLLALESLLHAGLESELARDSFLDLGTAPMEHDCAWRLLLEPGPPCAPPRPGEPPGALRERLIAAARDNGARRAWCELWSARCRHVAGDLAGAERRWWRLFRAARSERLAPSIQASLLAGLVAARLERFQPARAWELHAGHEPLAALDGALRRLLGWSALCCGETAHARRLLGGAGESRARLPGALGDLRRDRPEWNALLAGRLPAAGVAAASERSPSRRALGAVLLAVFVLGPGGPRPLVFDADPVRRAEFRRRLEARPVLESRERLACGGPVRTHRADDAQPGELHGALGAHSRAVALAPVRGSRDELFGWLHVESEHHLLPSDARLCALARGWSEELRARSSDSAGAWAPVRSRPDLRRESETSTRFTDEALGDLWRQDWRGNLRELVAIVAELARSHPDQEIDAPRLRAAFRSRSLPFVESLPPAQRAADVLCALKVTRHRNGAWNRSRAARYLGWSRQALGARIRACRLEEPEPAAGATP